MSFPREIRIENATEALIVEQALAMARDLKQVADDAPDGQVLARAEQAAVRQGRELTRKSLEAVLNAQGEDLKKNFAEPHLPMRRQPASSRRTLSIGADGWRQHPTQASVLCLQRLSPRRSSAG
jgi:hypothetical protein